MKLQKQKQKMKVINNIVILLIVFTSQLSAQFKYSASLPEVKSTAWYKITLLPEISMHLTDESDLRIYEEEEEVPYLIKQFPPVSSRSLFKEFKIISKQYDDSATTIILQPGIQKVEELVMMITKADVKKEIRITGSKDLQQWFVVKEKEEVIPANEDSSTISRMIISLQPTDYSYYKIEISDKNSEPVSVERIGSYITETVSSGYQEVKFKSVISDSIKTKSTWIKLSYPGPAALNAFEITVSSPALYKRKGIIYIEKNNRLTRAGTIELTSDKNNLIETDLIASSIYIQILNEDNKPLKISSVKTLQYKKYLLAYLEKNKSYQLKFGDSLLLPPSYDLKYFSNSIPANLTEMIPGKVVSLDTIVPEPTESLFSDKRILWTVLIVVLLLLSFITRKMISNL